MQADEYGFRNRTIWEGSIMWKLLCRIFALLMLVSALAGCADTTEETVYEAEFVDFGISEPDIYNGEKMEISLCGDAMYYVIQHIEEEEGLNGEYRYDIYCMQLGESGKASRLPIEIRRNYFLEYPKILPDCRGDYFLAYKTYGKIYVEKYDGEGKRLFNRQVAVREYDESDIEINEYLVGMVKDGAGNLYVAVKNDIYLLDGDGRICGTASLEPESIHSSINSIVCGMDGKVYCTADRKMYRIDFEASTAREVGRMAENFGMVPVSGSEFLVAAWKKLVLYQLEEDMTTDLVEWQDCDLDTERLVGLTRFEDGRAGVLFYEGSELRMALIQETDGRGKPQREVVTLGVVMRNENLRKSALAFNRQGGPCRVKVKEYWDYTPDSGMTLDEAIASLNLDIVSGSCPDIVNLQYGNLDSFASKGALEDLTHFLERSGLKKEDFVDAVLKAYTVDGKLLSLPNTFCINTVAVRSDLVGAKTAWTLDEMIELADSHPDSALFSHVTKQDALEFCMKMNLSCFMDWGKGTCCFDSEEFRKILEFSNRWPLKAVWTDDLDEIDVQYSSGKVLLCPLKLSSPDKISYIYEIYDWADLTFIGYPTIDGSPGHGLDGAGGAYAIFAKSPHKEGAWSFLEALQDSEGEALMAFAEGFPAKQDKLEALFEESMRDPYLTNPTPEKKENLVRRPVSGTASVRDGVWYEKSSYVPIPEEVEEIRRLISLARPAWQDAVAMSIIKEEAASYFHGQKTLDEVVGLIDNRVGLYMDEMSSEG